MKKILKVILSILLGISLVACHNNEKAKEPIKEQETIENQPADNDVTSQTTQSNKDDQKQEEIQKDPPKKEEEPKKDSPKKEEVVHTQDEVETVTYALKTSSSTITGLPSLPSITYKVKDPYNVRKLDSTRQGFSFGVAKNQTPHSITIENQRKFDSYQTNALAWDNKTQEKVIYLTFDCGYEYKNLTSLLLDTLKEKNVKATFFCTMPYLKDAPQVVKRMIEEGHNVGNHTQNHPSNCAALSRTKLAKEVLAVHNYLRTNFGYDAKYFRFPTGAYSQNALELVNSIGYKSIFWSIAYADWDPENQPGVEVSFETVTSRLHPGAVVLLHTSSPDNVEMLGRLIDYIREQGYELRTLNQYYQ